jgi:hypothetical protein
MSKLGKVTRPRSESYVPSRFKEGQEHGSMNLKSYDRAIKAPYLDMEEYWYQHVYNGGIVDKTIRKPSFYTSHLRRSIADFITRDIFSKTQQFNTEDLDNSIDTEIDTFYGLRSTNNDIYVNLHLFLDSIILDFTEGEIKVLASYLVKIKVDSELLSFDINETLKKYLIILREEQVKHKEALQRLFSSKHTCYVSVNSFKQKFASLIMNRA